jgi:hypothetical protein
MYHSFQKKQVVQALFDEKNTKKELLHPLYRTFTALKRGKNAPLALVKESLTSPLEPLTGKEAKPFSSKHMGMLLPSTARVNYEVSSISP